MNNPKRVAAAVEWFAEVAEEARGDGMVMWWSMEGDFIDTSRYDPDEFRHVVGQGQDIDIHESDECEARSCDWTVA